MKRVFLPAAFLSVVSSALAQSPFVANHVAAPIGADFQMGPAAFDWTDIPGTERVLTVPAGPAMLVWALSSYNGGGGLEIRPIIGTDAPSGGAFVTYPQTATGSWTTTVSGGNTTVRLQVRNIILGQPSTASFELLAGGAASVSWSLLVFPPSSGQVPVVSGWALVITALGLAGMATLILQHTARSGHSGTRV